MSGTSRRAFLLGSVLSFPLIPLGSNLLAAAAAELAAPGLGQYQPKFFTADEWRFLLAACDRLIPADEVGPGALEANVPIFIDSEVAGRFGRAEDWYMQGPFHPKAEASLGFQLPYSPQQIYRAGIKATEAFVQENWQMSFDRLPPERRDEVLTGLEKGEIDFARFGEAVLPAEVFFMTLLANSQEGYLSDPIYGGNKGMAAWVMIGFPGARASFLEWIGQHNVKYPLGPVSLSGARA